MGEWHVVVEVEWGPGGGIVEEVYAGVERLADLDELVRRAVEEVELQLPEGASVVGVRRVAAYQSLSDLCSDYPGLDPCGENR